MEMNTIVFAGQPNCGKSTLFNAMTGARQHVANYPGITVEKKSGNYIYRGEDVEIVDLPGTYSLTSYSPEERVARDFVLKEKPETVVSIVEALNLDRQLVLAFQLIEMDRPMVMYLNKKDAAERRNLEIDSAKLANILGLPVFYGTAKKREQVQELKAAVHKSFRNPKRSSFCVDYGNEIESVLKEVEKFLKPYTDQLPEYPLRWLSLKLLENDQEIRERFKESLGGGEELFDLIEAKNQEFSDQVGYSLEIGIAMARSAAASKIVSQCVVDNGEGKETVSDKIDQVVLHRVTGPIILLAIMYCFYWITMVGGQKITDLVFPYFQMFRNFISGLFPAETMLHDGLLRSLFLNGIVDGVVMILNYLPIFYALYLAIAILEDTGYMARIAFIMDRILRSFGLHGQSTLPMLLGGALVGGCAVPGVMATRTIKDEKARLVTILVIPLLNCMAKVPFYVLMVGIFFKGKEAMILWIFSVSTFIVALLIAKVLSSTIVKGEPEPFVLELPAYQVPTLQGVFIRATERLWLFIKKVATIVVAVSVLIWAGVSFPSVSKGKVADYDTRYDTLTGDFIDGIHPSYGRFFTTPEALVELKQFEDDYSIAKRRISSNNEKALQELKERTIMENPEFAKIVLKGKMSLAEEDVEPFKAYLNGYRAECSALVSHTLNETPTEFYSRWMQANPYYFALVRTGNVSLSGTKVLDSYAKMASKAWKGYSSDISKIKRNMKTETLHGSILGHFGKFLEPVSSLAGMDWKVNIAVLGSFAAKEALVSTLGTIYSIESDAGGAEALGKGIEKTGGFRGLHALAIMIFIAFFPPCLATIIMIKVETGSVKWMLFSIIYPIILGFLVASLFFQVGLVLGF